MKKNILISLFIVLLIVNLTGQQQWQDNGIPIRSGENIFWNQTTVILSDNSVIIFWSDTRNGFRNIYANKVDTSGNKLWGNGIHITDDEFFQFEPNASICSNDDVIVTWIDRRYEVEGDIFAQKISDNGELLWDNSGVPVCTASGWQYSVEMMSDTENGAYIFWNSIGTDIYGLHLNSNGNIVPGWEINGKAIADKNGKQNQFNLCQDGFGGGVIIWHDTRNYSDPNIFMQRFSSEGTIFWAVEGLLLCDNTSNQEYPQIAYAGHGEFIATWIDSRNQNSGDVYAQKIDVNGNTLWGALSAGIPVNTVSSYSKRNPQIVVTPEEEAIIVWEDERSYETGKDLYAQKLHSTGAVLWEPDGVAVVSEQEYQDDPMLVSDDTGGVWIVWEDDRDEGYPVVDIYVQNLNSSGNSVLEENGKQICSTGKTQIEPTINKTSDGKIFISWASGSNEYMKDSISYQILNEEGTELLPVNGTAIINGISGNVSNDLEVIENGNFPIIVWGDNRFESNQQLYFQITDPNGNVIHNPNGITVTDNTNSAQYDIDVTKYPDSDEFAVIWKENRYGFNYQAYAQIINTDGTMVGPPEGILLSTAEVMDQVFTSISSLNNNDNIEYYAGWSDMRDWLMGNGVYAQKIVNGEIQWDSEGVPVLDTDADDTLIDIVENYYFIQNGWWNDQNILVQKLDEDGNIAEGWSEDGLSICNETGNQYNVKARKTSQGLLIIWEDLRSGNDKDIYGQMIDDEGNILWEENGKALIVAVNDQDSFDIITDENEFYICWESFETGIHSAVRLNKFDYTGNIIWEPNGILVSSNECFDPKLAYINNKILISFGQRIEVSEDVWSWDVYSQLFDTSGQKLWAEEGLSICDADYDKRDINVVSGGQNDVYVFWQDWRTSGGHGRCYRCGDEEIAFRHIYGQKIHVNMTNAEDEIISSKQALSNYPNPFNPTTTISYNLSVEIAGSAKLVIYNLKGKKVKTFSNKEITESPNQQITWNGTDSGDKAVSSGIYFYRLESDKHSSETKKMILLK